MLFKEWKDRSIAVWQCVVVTVVLVFSGREAIMPQNVIQQQQQQHTSTVKASQFSISLWWLVTTTTTTTTTEAAEATTIATVTTTIAMLNDLAIDMTCAPLSVVVRKPSRKYVCCIYMPLLASMVC
jgi:hypothetical protein